ncbi:triphosphoribosyl-dephospho-CoA synthase CitG [Acidaminobacter sp. JC074]|uniref:triphosphoribosyl-dephospho-CoA synthase CitG n=1 Tax=Acidaminobacter sp. JC074 TaxID=2530199 RepID=UPI001F115643|nr:triphosphoribosyl-dephospho-CoA synthase CitG [Acidaminobacter sp. JC074]MCH4890679.1 triphosphoribosyl-dephospho-CoA synthase CitG [Acidaminobacter sp. JC074]
MDHRKIASLVNKAILYEVTTTPKPGLVDRNNSGAHKDMDYYTFISSACAIAGGFYEIAEVSYEFDGKPKDLLGRIRPIGKQMETDMFEATCGINTHKGIIFSLGILCAASVQVQKKESLNAENIIEYSKKMTLGITDELKNDKSLGKTNGERLYKNYGFLGIRGEVEAGFPSVMKSGLDALRNSYYTLQCKNELFIQTLFQLMTCVEDSNVLSRHNLETLSEVQEIAKNFLDAGGMFDEDAISYVEEMDRQFIKRNISPGGSADLLAVTLFLGLIEKIIE